MVWAKKRKGNATIYVHPDIDRAIVVNHYGITFNGRRFDSVDDAKVAATSESKEGEAQCLAGSNAGAGIEG